ncbi:uncharacterized protein PAN0_003d2058 [Moesziomyces antarcticus]|uniref:uncharacterized protein n=1 Tax=Pseudozyma antarctica TaxID=84753 RepID=UPI00071976DE|nr:uncharacterized protein PAN0_003d2058 [Moesziomyces antarcticus]GAK63849.1 conserved hypothetical protein [Moesziomyces antarcticus]
MRLSVVVSVLWLLVCALGAHAAGEDPVELEQGVESLSSTKLKDAVKQVPQKLNLGVDNFLGMGVKRKSVAGAYGTSAAVMLGAAAIGYQATNLRSQRRTAYKKKLKYLAAAQGRSIPGASSPPVLPVAQAEPLSLRRRYGTPWSQTQGRPTLEWKRRALTDNTLVAIEDYNKLIGANEGLASGGIAVTSAVEGRQRSLDAGTRFRC